MSSFKTVAIETSLQSVTNDNGQAILVTIYNNDNNTEISRFTLRDHRSMIAGSFKLPEGLEIPTYAVLHYSDNFDDDLSRRMSDEPLLDLDPDTLAGKSTEELAAKYAAFCHHSGDDVGLVMGAVIMMKAQNLDLLSAIVGGDNRMVKALAADLRYLARLAVEVECRAMDGMDIDDLTTAYERFCTDRNVPMVGADKRLFQVMGEPDSDAKTLEVAWLDSFLTNWDRAASAITHNYAVMGDDEVILLESDGLSDCRAWIKGYTARGDWGGYKQITIFDRDLNRDCEVFDAPEATPDGLADEV